LVIYPVSKFVTLQISRRIVELLFRYSDYSNRLLTELSPQIGMNTKRMVDSIYLQAQKKSIISALLSASFLVAPKGQQHP